MPWRTARRMRGAFWRNFQVKYREINDLHKRMLAVSEAVPLEIPANESTRKYLKAKKDKLGHRLSSV